MKTILSVFIGITLAFLGVSSVALARFPVEFELQRRDAQLYLMTRPVPAAEAPEGWPSWIGWWGTATNASDAGTGTSTSVQKIGGTWEDGWPSWIGRLDR
ncbi:MAG: hypothetical protein PHI23_00160 [Candidatus Peribacteraceae bacterium]|nr:hypothetical protein [Candidatus Peribacteraceae bacterium]